MRRHDYPISGKQKMFQPTHPHGVRQIPALRSKCTKWFQPTHPHGVRLPEHFPFSASHIVSTHAPARGATINVKKIEVVILVSTHAPARGATVSAGSDTVGGCVSTHAPARGATSLRPVLRYLHPVSTHAPARGATMKRRKLSEQVEEFQPTHPHGVRLISRSSEQ